MALTEDVIREMVAETIGTFILVAIGCGAALAGQPAEFAFGFSLVAIVYAIGKISGAHVNPAVTLGLALTGRFPMEKVPFYWVSQVLGALVAAVVLRIVYGGDGNLASTVVTEGFSTLDGFIIELVATAIFVFVITAAATDDRTPAAAVGIAIGFALFVAALFSGPITGGSLNPARSLGPAIVSGTFTDLWIYLTAPFIGGAIGAVAYEFTRGGEGAIALQRAITQRHRDDPAPGRRPAQRRAPQPVDAEQPAPRQRRPQQAQRPPAYEEDLAPEEYFEEPLPPQRPAQRPPQQRPQYDPNAPQPQQRPQQRRRPPQ